MKRLIFIAMCVAASMIGFSASAQMRSSYFMEGSYFRTDLNPALAPTRGYVALPGLGGFGMNINNNFLSVDNFFYKNGDEVVTALHESVSADKFLGKLPNTGRLSANLNIRSAKFDSFIEYSPLTGSGSPALGLTETGTVEYLTISDTT